SPVARPPNDGDNDPVPEGKNAAPSRSIDVLGVMPAEHFVAKCGTQDANHGIDRRRNERDLDAARPGKRRQTGVIMLVDRVRERLGFRNGLLPDSGLAW